MKKIVLILITVLLSVTLTGCRIKSGDSEIICDENGCTTNEPEESGNNPDSDDMGIKPGDADSGHFNVDTCEGGQVCGGNTSCGSKYNLYSPAKGIFGSFPYYDSEPSSTVNRNSLEMCPEWKNKNFTSVSTTCSNGKIYKWTVNVKAATTFKSVQEKFCEFITSGVDGITYSESEIKVSGPTVIRFVSGTKSISLHSYGIAIDINPSNSYTVDGVKYPSPYGRDIDKYNNFIKALGKEDDTRNVNYILWKKVFQPLGFKWGGNWGRDGKGGTYDGMHFEIDWRQTK